MKEPMKTIHIIGGGTMSHVRNHLSLCAPAYGSTAIALKKELDSAYSSYKVDLHLTKMADSSSRLETSDDIDRLLDHLIADPNTRCIIFNPALVDFNGEVTSDVDAAEVIRSGKHARRLKTRNGAQQMTLTPAKKLIGKIRATRKDIFVVGFKTTTDATPDEQYAAGLRLLKENSLNLVLANDVVTRRNVIIAPEETQYFASHNRTAVLGHLARMTLSRLKNTFTRSTVVPGEAVPWSSDKVPANLRDVVNFCIEQGAYKTVLGKTAGHFAVRSAGDEILTTIRKSNFNQLDKTGMVRVQTLDDDRVIAHGAKPSVGGQSQRIIFSEHPDVDCIVHFHCPAKDEIARAPQWPNECGSHECGRNTSKNLHKVDLGDGDYLKVVMLDDHGPNIVFPRTTPAAKVKSFITKNFDLSSKTGGLVPESVR